MTRYHQAHWRLFEACPIGHAAQGEIPDSSWSDCATMLGGLPPEVPRTIDDFQQYLLTGTVALTPSFRSRLVATCPVQDYTFAAASEGSILAMKMTSLVGDYDSAAGMHVHHLPPFILKDEAICSLTPEIVTPAQREIQKHGPCCPAICFQALKLASAEAQGNWAGCVMCCARLDMCCCRLQRGGHWAVHDRLHRWHLEIDPEVCSNWQRI